MPSDDLDAPLPPPPPDSTLPPTPPPGEEVWHSLLLKHSHDGFVKAFLGDLTQARSLFSEYLPANIVPAVDFESLRREPTSFVEQSLRQSHSDLLFSANLRDGKAVKFYILFEHQTTQDEFMALRMLNYVVEILRKWIDDRTAQKLPSRPLPVVFPFLLSQGPDAWKVSTEFLDLFELGAEMKPIFADYLPKFRYHLLDLTTQQPELQTKAETLRAALYLMKLARQKDQMMEWLKWLDEQPFSINLPLLSLFLLYMLHCEKSIDLEVLRTTIWKNETITNATMSLAEQLISEGEARGEARGVAFGEAMGRLWMLQELMEKPVQTREDLANFSLQELQDAYEQLQSEYNVKFKL